MLVVGIGVLDGLFKHHPFRRRGSIREERHAGSDGKGG
jgi:hypothetical protein